MSAQQGNMTSQNSSFVPGSRAECAFDMHTFGAHGCDRAGTPLPRFPHQRMQALRQGGMAVMQQHVQRVRVEVGKVFLR